MRVDWNYGNESKPTTSWWGGGDLRSPNYMKNQAEKVKERRAIKRRMLHGNLEYDTSLKKWI